MIVSADELSVEEAQRRISDVLPGVLGGDFVTGWVLIADVVMPDGEVGTWHLTAQDIRAAQHLGLLEWAATQVRSVITEEGPS